MGRKMMYIDRHKLLPARTGNTLAHHGRFAPRTGWIGAGWRLRIVAGLIAGAHGGSVPNGRRLRS